MKITSFFTPLERSSIYAGDGGNTCKSRSISSLLRAGSKLCPFKRGLLLLSVVCLDPSAASQALFYIGGVRARSGLICVLIWGNLWIILNSEISISSQSRILDRLCSVFKILITSAKRLFFYRLLFISSSPFLMVNIRSWIFRLNI